MIGWYSPPAKPPTVPGSGLTAAVRGKQKRRKATKAQRAARRRSR